MKAILLSGLALLLISGCTGAISPPPFDSPPPGEVSADPPPPITAVVPAAGPTATPRPQIRTGMNLSPGS